ncbi:hypothetical protein N7478_008376 [Penicillium angulare]|uniref:uncharacterized protein n=1 Tax=Penicillium angulare TaxID=116970 RepID=UPI0025409F7F|nr:uncharacterized protein N7478_008376 [Penicillium angulare]KAJ5273251.1 hypothetical protein N7478_008376 [Penicillium angulare]
MQFAPRKLRVVLVTQRDLLFVLNLMALSGRSQKKGAVFHVPVCSINVAMDVKPRAIRAHA